MNTSYRSRMAEELGDPDRKRAYNQALFTEVAPRYDVVTRALSLGRDRAWKRRLIAALPDENPGLCVDLACGTGDITRMLAARYPGSTVVGIDLTPSMLEIAQRIEPALACQYRQADLCDTGLEPGSADVVTGGYALRNAPDLVAGLREVRRVLRPGGVAAFLDFSKPPSSTLQRIEHGLLHGWGGLWGWVLHRDPEVYQYIAQSLGHYPDRRALARMVRDQGFAIAHQQRFFGGIMELLVLTRDADPS